MKRIYRIALVLAVAGLVGAIYLGQTDALAGPQMAAEDTEQHQSAQPLVAHDMSLGLAQKVVHAAMDKAKTMNVAMDIAVVDAGGNLKTFVRMDGAWLGSIDIAIKKARTSRYFDMPTGVIGELSQPGGPLYQIEVSNGGLITFPGGVPLKLADGTVVGAIGVSGSTVENDHAVASAGAAAMPN